MVNRQVLLHADTRQVLVIGGPLPGNRNDCTASAASGVNQAAGAATMIADGGYRGTGLLIPYRRKPGQAALPAGQEGHNASHRQVRARVKHVFARMKSWKILRDCRRRGAGVHLAALGIAHLHNLAWAGCPPDQHNPPRPGTPTLRYGTTSSVLLPVQVSTDRTAISPPVPDELLPTA